MKNIILFILVFSFCLTLYAEEKPIISVLDFYTEEGISKSEMRLFISLLSSALFQTKLYTVIDVSERDTLLSELEFSVADCTDESCQLEIGRLLAAEAIIIGRIGRLGTRYVLSIKMLETDTGRAINTADGVYDSIDNMVDDVGVIAKNLASVHREESTEKVIVEKDVTEDVVIAGTDETDKDIKETETDEMVEDVDLVPTPAPAKDKFISFSISIEGGPKFPLQELGEIFHPGSIPLMLLDLEINVGIGKLGIGIVAGADFESVRDEEPVINPYEMVIIPAGGNIKFTTGFMFPFYLFLEGMIGIAFGKVTYASHVDMEDLEFVRPFIGLSAGAGYAFTRNFRIGLCGTYMIIAFNEEPLHGIAPLVRAEIHF